MSCAIWGTLTAISPSLLQPLDLTLPEHKPKQASCLYVPSLWYCEQETANLRIQLYNDDIGAK